MRFSTDFQSSDYDAWDRRPPRTQGIVPDRLCVDKTSKFFSESYRDIGVRFNGVDRPGDVQEYCASEGWLRVRIRDGKGRFRINPDGSYVIARIEGLVEPYWRKKTLAEKMASQPGLVARDHAGALAAAEAKRKRKAERNARLAE